MTSDNFRLARRPFLLGLGAAIGSAGPMSVLARSKPRATLSLKIAPATAALRDSGKPSPIWSLEASRAIPHFRQGDDITIDLSNDLPVATALTLRGLNGIADPLAVRLALAAGTSASFDVTFAQAGTMLLDARLLGDDAQLASPLLPVIVETREPLDVDRDEVLLIEDWRLKLDGSSAAPGGEPKDAAGAIYTVNRKPALDLQARANDRLRLRFVNGCQRSVISIKIEDHVVRVMAIDSQPSEPFTARDGQLVLAPGTRIDAFIDATGPAGSVSQILLHNGVAARPIGIIRISAEAPLRQSLRPEAPPLPSNGLPATLDLKNALRAISTSVHRHGLRRYIGLRGHRQFLPQSAGGQWFWGWPTRLRRRLYSGSAAITPGCSTDSTTAGSRFGWIRSLSAQNEPNALPLSPRIQGVG